MKKKDIVLKFLLLLEGILIVGLFCYVGHLDRDKRGAEQFELTSSSVPAVVQEKQYTEEEIVRIAKEGLLKYRLMLSEYFMSYLQTKENLTENDQVSINGVEHYFLVTDERYPTLQSVKNHIETICIKEYAEKLYKELWDLDGERPFLVEMDGRLYTQVADTTFGLGDFYIPVAYVNEEGDIVFFYKCIHEEGSDFEWVEEGIMTLEKQNDIWYVKNVEEWK